MKKNFLNFLKQMLQEDEGGKLSSKKFWGHFVMLTVCLSFILSGFDFYKVKESMFDSMLLAGVSLLGLSMITRFAPNNSNNRRKDKNEK